MIDFASTATCCIPPEAFGAGKSYQFLCCFRLFVIRQDTRSCRYDWKQE